MAAPAEEEPVVINLMEALQKSVAAAKATAESQAAQAGRAKRRSKNRRRGRSGRSLSRVSWHGFSIRAKAKA